jgi:hypothetical protein
MKTKAQDGMMLARSPSDIFEEAVDHAALMLWYEALLSLMVNYYTQLHILEHGEESDPKLRQLSVLTEDHVLLAGRFHIMQAGKVAYLCESTGLGGEKYSDLMEQIMAAAKEKADHDNEPSVREIKDFWEEVGSPWLTPEHRSHRGMLQ